MTAKITRNAILRSRQCSTCGGAYESRSSKKIYCDACRLERDRKGDRERAARKARTLGVRPIGAIIICRDCGKEFTLTAGPQKTCEVCRPLRFNTWMRTRNRTSIQHNLSDRMRRRINEALGRGEKAGRKWPALLGYTLPDLMAHLERQFLPGMTWENRQDWEIDHIQPLASFAYRSADDDEFRAAWALSNLQPLWTPDNRKKSAKRLQLL